MKEIMNDKEQYVCTTCGYIHDENTDGYFDDLPKYYNCPECGTAKDDFVKVD